jgi:hypothetical protein
MDSVHLRGLVGRIDSIGFLDFPDSLARCEPTMSDRPSAIITVTMRGRTNSVYHYLGDDCGPDYKSTRELEEAIDGLTQSNRWIELPGA